MKPGDFEIHAPKKIESFKYSYLHTLKVKRGKKVRCCKSGLQKQGLKRVQPIPNIAVKAPVAKAVYKNKD